MPRTRFALVFALLCLALPLAAADRGVANAAAFGPLTLLPPVLAIALAFLTRNVLLALFCGVFSGTLLLAVQAHGVAGALPQAFLDLVRRAQGAVADSWNAGILLQVFAIGGLIALMTRSGGLRAFAEKIARRATTPVGAQLTAWLLGFAVFFDDYANALIVGPAARPVTDRVRVSREKLAFIVDATSAPVAGMALISTWVAYELGLLHAAFTAIGSATPAWEVLVRTLPYRFYNIFILFFIPAAILMRREFGPMLAAERRCRETGEVLRPGARPLQADEPAPGDAGGGAWLMLVPLLVLVTAAFAGFWYDGHAKIMAGPDEKLRLALQQAGTFESLRLSFGKASAATVLFQAALLAGLVSLGLWRWRQKQPLADGITAWLSGARAMILTAVVLVLAWSLSGVLKELGTAAWLARGLSGTLPPALLPALIFLLGAVISFATGTSYGTMGILMPLAVPLAQAVGKGDPELVILASGAVLTGAIFGDHCSPISDTTILSSTGTACDHMDHTRTQLPYALVVAGVALLCGFLPAGLGVSPWLLLPAGMGVLLLILRVVGKRISP